MFPKVDIRLNNMNELKYKSILSKMTTNGILEELDIILEECDDCEKCPHRLCGEVFDWEMIYCKIDAIEEILKERT